MKSVTHAAASRPAIEEPDIRAKCSGPDRGTSTGAPSPSGWSSRCSGTSSSCAGDSSSAAVGSSGIGSLPSFTVGSIEDAPQPAAGDPAAVPDSTRSFHGRPAVSATRAARRGEPRADDRAAGLAAAHRELAAGELDPLAHPDEAEATAPGVAALQPAAVVGDEHVEGARLLLHAHGHPARVSVLGDVRQRLLHEAVDGRLELVGQPDVLVGEPEVALDLEAGRALGPLEERGQRGEQAELVE